MVYSASVMVHNVMVHSSSVMVHNAGVGFTVPVSWSCPVTEYESVEMKLGESILSIK